MTTATIDTSGSERMFRAATVLALLIAVAALTLALLNRPSSIGRTGAVAVTAVPATRATSMAALVPGGSVYNNQVPSAGRGAAGGIAHDDDGEHSHQVSQHARHPGPQL